MKPPLLPRKYTREPNFGNNTLEGFLRKNIQILFDDEPAGFFIEAGAYDGLFQSNTLYLENQRNWTGLLVEPNEHSFISLTKRHRNAWTCNVCLSPFSYPYQVFFFILK